MKRQLLFLLLCLGLTSGCATTSYQRASATSVRMDETVKSLTQASRDLDTAVSSLNGLQGRTGSDLRQQYQLFTKRVNLLVSREKQLIARQNQLDAVSREYFSSWQDELKKFKSSDLKKKSRQRRLMTIDVYDRMFDALQVQQESYQLMLNDFADIRRYLGYDLTPDAVNSISENIRKANDDSKSVQQKITQAINELQRTPAPTASEAASAPPPVNPPAAPQPPQPSGQK
ncbi:MAG: DUF2959 family protein [Deltaproteobacteria bacterium]